MNTIDTTTLADLLGQIGENKEEACLTRKAWEESGEYIYWLIPAYSRMNQTPRWIKCNHKDINKPDEELVLSVEDNQASDWYFF